MRRPVFTRFASAVLLAFVLGTLACAIFALLSSKAESAASRAEGAPAGRGIGRDGQSALRLVGERVLPPVICGDFAEMAEGLRVRFGEVVTARGQIGPDMLLVVLASPDGSFTVLAVRATGHACLVAAGRGWEERL